MMFWAKCSLIIGGVLMLLPRLRGEASEKAQRWGFDEFTAQCDFSRVVNKTMKEASWEPDFAETVKLGYQRFLYIIYKFDGAIGVPSEAVDRVWHNHILDTQRYFKDTRTLFGRYLHHMPSYDIEEKLALAPEAANFVSLYESEFGPMDPAVWPEYTGKSGSCGNCKASLPLSGGCGSCKTAVGVGGLGCGSCKSET